MAWRKRYDPQTMEEELTERWQRDATYRFDLTSHAPVYSIDTPPPSISGHLHLGHVYSYSHTDFIARYRRMKGDNVFYPMGFDDNGLPTERLVERRMGITAADVGREAFIRTCLQASKEFVKEYRELWLRLGLSVDWQHTYHTIDDLPRRTAQQSFIDLYHRDLAYRGEAPVIWCPECQTAIAQAEVEDLDRDTEFVTVSFERQDGKTLSVATTRPELLPACVAVFVHPEDERYRSVTGQEVVVPLSQRTVPVLADPAAQQEKGTGAVMCCTFGDTTDIEWWYTHHLPLRPVIDRDGRLTADAGSMAGETVPRARESIKRSLREQGKMTDSRAIHQTVRVHDRCGTPVEYIVTRQWFIKVLDHKATFLRAGDLIRWHPEHMKARYREWIENLRWDWLISRQRYYGVPFPVWYCACGQILLADESQLPIDPTTTSPSIPCGCGSDTYVPEKDVMDTWATSSLSPQIVGRQLDNPDLYNTIYPMSLRPQAHEIIRTWAFYTIVQSHFHGDRIPWSDVMISGWGLAPQGQGKISKSKGAVIIAPMDALKQYSADALRYWAASTGVGKDSIISEEKIESGAKLGTKLWNLAGFSHRFLEAYVPPVETPPLSPADRWILSTLQRVVGRSTLAFDAYDYMTAKNETEIFFWRDLADNYLEMAKRRLYDTDAPLHEAAQFTLYHVLLTTLQLFAPIIPYVTERIYLDLFLHGIGVESIHRTAWPKPHTEYVDGDADVAGGALVGIATAVRRFKSEHAMSLGAELSQIEIQVQEPRLARALRGADDDILSVTRARRIVHNRSLDSHAELIRAHEHIGLVVKR